MMLIGGAFFGAVLVGAGDASADLEHQFRIAIVKRRDLGVWRFLIVVGGAIVFSTSGADALRQPAAKAPARDIHFVNALVADIAVAGVPEPMPVVGKT